MTFSKTLALLSAAVLSLALVVNGQSTQDLTVPKLCFGQSRDVYGPIVSSGTPFSNQPQLGSGSYTLGMRLTGVKGCYTETNSRFVGIRLTFSDAQGETLTLNEVGDVSGTGGATCETLELGSSDFIDKVVIGWDGQGVNSVSLIMTRGTAQYGKVKISQGSVEFDGREIMFAGFYGKSNFVGIQELGLVAFRPEYCAQLMQEAADQQNKDAQQEEEEDSSTTSDDATTEDQPNVEDGGESTSDVPQSEQPVDGQEGDQAVETAVDVDDDDGILIDNEQATAYSAFFDFITDPDEIYAQFSSFSTPDSEPSSTESNEEVSGSTSGQQDDEAVTALNSQDDNLVKLEEESSMMIPIMVGCVVLILAIIACIVCSRLCRSKSVPVAAQKSKASSGDEEMGEAQQDEGDDNENQIDDGTSTARSGAPESARKLLADTKHRSEGKPETNIISVEEQHEEPDTMSPTGQELAQGQRRSNSDDLETKSTPEVQHPAVSQTLETIDEMVGENAIATSINPSGIATGERRSHDNSNNLLSIKNGSNGQELPYVEEESSMAMINLAHNSGQKQARNDQAGDQGILPVISQNRGKNLFTDVTPDTKGQPQKRFQEIIDSDDETNGNGSKMLRMQNRKFRNKTDAFGDVDAQQNEEVEASAGQIDFPIKAGESEEVLDLKTGSEASRKERDTTKEKASTNTAPAKDSKVEKPAPRKNSQRRATQPKNGKKK